jgi:AraC-like DNA-binding protein
VASCPSTPSATRRSFRPIGSRGFRPGSRTTTARTATPTCGSSSCRRPSPGWYRAIPPCSRPSDLAREILLTLTGPPNDDRATGNHDRGPSARLRRVLVDELREAPEQPLQLPQPCDDRLQAIAQLLYDDPADNSALAELGRRVGASARTLSRLMRNELGLTFYEWRTQLRIYHALVLLADGNDTTHVAHACGWANPSSFIAAFTTVIGTTPGRHRAGHQPAGWTNRAAGCPSH